MCMYMYMYSRVIISVKALEHLTAIIVVYVIEFERV